MSRQISFNGQTFVVPDDATDDEITQIAGGGSSKPAPNAGLAPPPRPAFMGGQVKPGSTAGQSPLITSAPEESGLETGPLVANNPAENDTLTHGAGSARALARMANAAGDALNPMTQVPALFHAATDKAAPGETPVGIPNVPPALANLVSRTMVQPTANAIQDYAGGRVSSEAAAAVAPEALGSAAGNVVGGAMMDKILGAAANAKTPMNTQQAGQLFAPIDAAAEKVPIDISAARKIAEEARATGDAGATVPPVLKKFLSRTEPTPANFPFPATKADDILYPEGRLFAQNAGRLSAADTMASNPNMQRLVGKFADALRTANRDAAAQVGMGDAYDEAMKAYGSAAKRRELMDNLTEYAKQAVIKTAIGGALGAGFYGAYKAAH